MERLRLVRVSETTTATFGVLTQAGEAFAVTMEPPWKDNAPNVSCIPPSIYICAATNSPKFGYTFEIVGVHGRSAILFHCGNSAENTRGCVLVGEQFEKLDSGVAGILASRAGFREFMFRLRGVNAFEIEIVDATGEIKNG